MRLWVYPSEVFYLIAVIDVTGIEDSDSGNNTGYVQGTFIDDGSPVVSWSDGTKTEIPYRVLRLACRCALCIEEMTGKALLDPTTVPEDIGVATCEEVGLYGLQIGWSTSHNTGIYTWDRLRALGSPEGSTSPGSEGADRSE